MEGASWIANKAMQEANKLNQKLDSLRSEFERRSTMCVTDPTINEVNGVDFIKLRDWTSEYIDREAVEVLMRFETLLENVNYNMRQANQTFNKKK